MSAKKNVATDTDELPPETPLPSLGVSRALAGTEVKKLRLKVEALEREIINGPHGPSGMQTPYLVQRSQDARKELEEVNAEIERIEAMDGNQVRAWAYRRGQR